MQSETLLTMPNHPDETHRSSTKKLLQLTHSHVNLKPTAVLDHLKIKVKRRCSSHRTTTDGNDDETDDEGHNANRSRRLKKQSNREKRRNSRPVQ